MLFKLKEDSWEITNLADSNPEKAAEMGELLTGITDYYAVDAKVKKYDKKSFAQWGEEQLAVGTYYGNISCVFSGWSGLEDSEIQP